MWLYNYTLLCFYIFDLNWSESDKEGTTLFYVKIKHVSKLFKTSKKIAIARAG
jgi:hypothetical protein